MSEIRRTNAIMRFEDEVLTDQVTLGEIDWYSLSLGYFLGMNFSTEESKELAQVLLERNT